MKQEDDLRLGPGTSSLDLMCSTTELTIFLLQFLSTLPFNLYRTSTLCLAHTWRVLAVEDPVGCQYMLSKPRPSVPPD